MSQRATVGLYVAVGVLLLALRVVIASTSSHMPPGLALILNLAVVGVGVAVVVDFFRRFRGK